MEVSEALTLLFIGVVDLIGSLVLFIICIQFITFHIFAAQTTLANVIPRVLHSQK